MSNYDKLLEEPHTCRLSVENLNIFHHDKQILFDVTLPIEPQSTTALIGPSGCGKSTLLRALNRMTELAEGMRMEGRVLLNHQDIYAEAIDVVYLRSRIGMVFQKPCPFPMTIYDNVAYGPRIHRLTRTRDHLDEVVQESLKKADLWEDVRDRLFESARGLSGGQQQRLCIARAIAINPDVLLMDEPTSALDPIATARIEELIDELRKRLTIVLVTHNLQQAARISQKIGFFIRGSLVEYGDTESFFTRPQDARTQAYLTRSR